MSVTHLQSLQTWERAEIVRSSVEASLTPDALLRTNPAQIARYDAPPATTPYRLEYAYHLLGDVRGRRVVDLGCGSGENSLLLAGRGASLYGVDISADLIRLANRRLAANGRVGAARFLVASAHDLPLPSGSIDIVFGMAILHHLDLQLIAREVHRVLKPGGRGIFQEPVRNSALVRLLRPLIPYRAPDVSPFERPLTDADLEAFAAPFTRTRMRAFILPYVRLGELLPFPRGHRDLLYRSDAWLLQRFPWLRYYASVRVFEVVK